MNALPAPWLLAHLRADTGAVMVFRNNAWFVGARVDVDWAIERTAGYSVGYLLPASAGQQLVIWHLPLSNTTKIGRIREDGSVELLGMIELQPELLAPLATAAWTGSVSESNATLALAAGLHTAPVDGGAVYVFPDSVIEFDAIADSAGALRVGLTDGVPPDLDATVTIGTTWASYSVAIGANVEPRSLWLLEAAGPTLIRHLRVTRSTGLGCGRPGELTLGGAVFDGEGLRWPATDGLGRVFLGTWQAGILSYSPLDTSAVAGNDTELMGYTDRLALVGAGSPLPGY